MANKELNPFTEAKNAESPVKVEEAQIIGESRAIAPVKHFAMPLASVSQIKEASDKYQKFLSALLKTSDVQEIESKDPKTGKMIKKLAAKKSGFGKIARFWGISTEIIREFSEQEECTKNVCATQYDYNTRQYVPRIRRGDHYTVSKAWVKAILPNGQFAVRGGACSEVERGFAHLTHDLMTTAETRAAKRAIEAVIGMGEIDLAGEEDDNGPADIPPAPPPGKSGKKKPPKESSSPSPPPPPDAPLSIKQRDYIDTAMAKIGLSLTHTFFNIPGPQGKTQKTFEELSNEDGKYVMGAITKGRETFLSIVERIP